MKVDSFRFVSPLIKRYYQLSRVSQELPIPFTPLKKPLAESRLALVTTGGLYHLGRDKPFDQERELLAWQRIGEGRNSREKLPLPAQGRRPGSC